MIFQIKLIVKDYTRTSLENICAYLESLISIIQIALEKLMFFLDVRERHLPLAPLVQKKIAQICDIWKLFHKDLTCF